MKRRLWLSLGLLFSGALLAIAQPNTAKPVVVLPKASELKGSLSPLPLPSGTNTQALLAQIHSAVEKGRDVYQASLRFDESYRAFMGVVSFLQDKAQPGLLCKSPEAARAYFAASAQLGEFQVLRLQFSALLEPLRLANDQTLTPSRKQDLTRVLSYETEANALAPIVDALFTEQLRAEIEARSCAETALRLAAKDTHSLVLKPSVASPKPGTQLPSQAVSVPFNVNNVDCGSPFVVFLDGLPVGTASANSVSSFSAVAGSHALCLAPASDPSVCDDPQNQVVSYLYEGWWIRAQCPGE